MNIIEVENLNFDYPGKRVLHDINFTIKAGSVTALVVQDVLGGDILRTRTAGGTHFYNLVDGVRWDFTVSQFDRPIPFEDTPASRAEAMADTSSAQYDALRRRLGLDG